MRRTATSPGTLKRLFWSLPLLLALGCVSERAPVAGTPGQRTAETVCEFAREERPEGLSGLAHIGGDRYYAVDDRDGLLHELKISVNAEDEVTACEVVRSVRLEGRRDLEGCAYDPLDGRVWVSDEHDTSVRQFDPQTGRETARVTVPDVFLKNVVPNRSFEGLAISPDGLRLYVANEDTLRCDGAVAGNEQGGVVRIQEFARDGAGSPWTPTRQLFYPTDPVEGDAYRGIAISGVAALVAPGDGTLLVLEREMSLKNPLVPSFRGRLYEVDLADVRQPVGKRLLWDENTYFSNYEGMSLGPRLKDGSRALALVSDGGGEAEENVLLLSLRSGGADVGQGSNCKKGESQDEK